MEPRIDKPPLAAAPPPRRSRQLDFLRGIAILLVLAHHLHLEIPHVPVLHTLFDVPHTIGWVGVDLFFTLSGFLVGGLLIMELDKYGTIDAKRFLVRRGLKIYPLYYVFFGYLFARPMLETAVRGGDLGGTFAELWDLYWPNLLFLNGYLGDNPIGHTWTLAIEEHFYLALPFVLLAVHRRMSMQQIGWMCALLFVPVALWRSYLVYDPEVQLMRIKETHYRIDALFFGVAIRAYAATAPDGFARLKRYRFALIALGTALLASTPYLGEQEQRSIGYVMTMFGAGALLIGTYHSSSDDIAPLGAFGSWVVRWTCWIGTYSYAIYLWHITVIRSLEKVVENKLGYDPETALAFPLWLASAVVILGAAVVFSAITSRLVEIPVLKLRDRMFPSRSRSIPN